MDLQKHHKDTIAGPEKRGRRGCKGGQLHVLAPAGAAPQPCAKTPLADEPCPYCTIVSKACPSASLPGLSPLVRSCRTCSIPSQTEICGSEGFRPASAS